MATKTTLAESYHRWSPVIGASIANVVVFVAVLSIPLSAGDALGLATRELASWIMMLYGGAAALTILLVVRYRQPLIVTGNMFMLLFIVSLGTRISWPELVGAAMVAGVAVLVLGPLGLIGKLAAVLPTPVVHGLLAGAVLPLFVRLFDSLGDDVVVVSGVLLAFLLTRRRLGQLALLPALLTGLAAAWLTGAFGGADRPLSLPVPTVTLPSFSLSAIATATPVMIVLIALQANVPSMVFLRGQGYVPPERTVTVMSGIGTTAASLFGPIGMSLSLPSAAMCGGPDAGDVQYRHRTGYLVSIGGLTIAALAGAATTVATILPAALLNAMAGLAVLAILSTALQQVSKGPLLLGPLFAFGIALSNLTVFGLGPFFWALVGGIVVTFVLERDAMPG